MGNMMSKRFELKERNIYDRWTGYTYEFGEYNDWEDICGLLNQIHTILENVFEDVD